MIRIIFLYVLAIGGPVVAAFAYGRYRRTQDERVRDLKSGFAKQLEERDRQVRYWAGLEGKKHEDPEL